MKRIYLLCIFAVLLMSGCREDVETGIIGKWQTPAGVFEFQPDGKVLVTPKGETKPEVAQWVVDKNNFVKIGAPGAPAKESIIFYVSIAGSELVAVQNGVTEKWKRIEK